MPGRQERPRTDAQQRIRPDRELGKYIARDRQNITTFFHREPSGDQRPRSRRGFDHDDRPREAGEDSISLGKVVSSRWRAGRILRDQRTLRGELCG